MDGVRRVGRAATLVLSALAISCGEPEGALVPEAGADGAADASDATIAEDADAGAFDASISDVVDAGPTDVSEEPVVDASPDAADSSPDVVDAAQDAAVDAPPPYCGDGNRDPTEECDDGVQSLLLDSCSSLCEVRDLLAVRGALDAGVVSRTLGLGRHPLGGGATGLAVSWIETSTGKLGMTFYDAKGIPTGKVDRFGVGTTTLTTSAPVVAGLPSGVFATAFTDMGGDGDGEGIAIRRVDPSVASSGAPAHANTTTAFGQYDADIVWTGTQLVVAWADNSSTTTGPDLRYRTFDANLNPTSAEQTLAATVAVEANVALTAFAGGWAAAWREASNGLETIRARAGGMSFSVGPFLPGPYHAPPAIAELDSSHLLLVYVENKKLRGALLDLAQPGVVTAFDLPVLSQGPNPPPALWANAVRVGSGVLVAWASEAVLADPRAEETWLKVVGWNGVTVDLTVPELPLPRWDAHRLGDQRFPALGAAGAALGAAWLDLASNFAGSANNDVIVEVVPTPILRNPNADGGGL